MNSREVERLLHVVPCGRRGRGAERKAVGRGAQQPGLVVQDPAAVDAAVREIEPQAGERTILPIHALEDVQVGATPVAEPGADTRPTVRLHQRCSPRIALELGRPGVPFLLEVPVAVMTVERQLVLTQ